MEPNWSVGAAQQPDPNGRVKYPNILWRPPTKAASTPFCTMRAPANSALAEKKYWQHALLTSVFCHSRGLYFRDKTKPLLFRWRVRRPSNHSTPSACPWPWRPHRLLDPSPPSLRPVSLTSQRPRSPPYKSARTRVDSRARPHAYRRSPVGDWATRRARFLGNLGHPWGQVAAGREAHHRREQAPVLCTPGNGKRPPTIQRTCDDTASWPPQRPADGQQRSALRREGDVWCLGAKGTNRNVKQKGEQRTRAHHWQNSTLLLGRTQGKGISTHDNDCLNVLGKKILCVLIW